MIKRYKSMSILELKKILQKKGFKISRLKNNQFDKYFKSFYLTTLSSFILIIVLASLPLLDTAIDETFSKSKITENLSKKYLEKALSGETLVTEIILMMTIETYTRMLSLKMVHRSLLE